MNRPDRDVKSQSLDSLCRYAVCTPIILDGRGWCFVTPKTRRRVVMSELPNRRSRKSIAIARLGVRLNWLALLPMSMVMLSLTTVVASPAFARDPASLADLSIPANRVPDWRPLDYLPLDTSAWTQTSVACNGGDHNAIRNAFDAAGSQHCARPPGELHVSLHFPICDGQVQHRHPRHESRHVDHRIQQPRHRNVHDVDRRLSDA